MLYYLIVAWIIGMAIVGYLIYKEEVINAVDEEMRHEKNMQKMEKKKFLSDITIDDLIN